ncbi:MAG: hypothetical protein IKR80_03255, partial [Spirochaetales bacterium]|nr:hypothetical protein [Spirochaetales bacterium]
VRFDLPETDGDCFLTAQTFDKSGREVSTEQIEISACIPSEENEGVAVTGALPSWFEIKEGIPTISCGDKTLAAAEPYTLLYRAETDNDSINFVRKPMRRWYKEKNVLLGCRRKEKQAVTEWAVKAAGKTFLCTDKYEGCRLSDGTEGVLVTSLIIPLKAKGRLPRFAKAFRTDESFDSVSYFGRSGESYIDMKEQFPVTECTCKVADMVEPSVKPQESGNRCDVRRASVSDGKQYFLFTAVDKAFELSVKPYSDSELIGMKHRCDEKRTGTYVAINAFQQGIGTGSCGPYALDEHCYDAAKDHVLRFVISLENM